MFKEPLLHFILIGAAFFLLYGWVGETENNGDTITIDESDLEEIVSKFEMQWKRMPTEEELFSIVEKRIEHEVFYQEALKMNLDHNDEIIKRRLSQKMQFLSNDISGLVAPTDEQLKEMREQAAQDMGADRVVTVLEHDPNRYQRITTQFFEECHRKFEKGRKSKGEADG